MDLNTCFQILSDSYLLKEAEHYEEAVQMLKQLLKQLPKRITEPDAKKLDKEIQEFIHSHEDEERLGENINSFNTLIAYIYNLLGDCYISLKEYGSAIRDLEYTLEVYDSNSIESIYLLGFTYSQIQDYEKAIRYHEKAFSIDSSDPEIMRCLGWDIFRHYKHKKQCKERYRGLALLERAKTLRPDNIDILLDLAGCYLLEKQFNKAGAAYNDILELESRHEQARLGVLTCSALKQKEKSKNKKKF